MANRILATSVCFACVTLWHLPITQALILWISFNLFCVNCEMIATLIGTTTHWRWFESMLDRAGSLRLHALLSVPFFAMALLSNIFFLSNEDVGSNLVNRLISKSSFTASLALFLYFGANVSIDYHSHKHSKDESVGLFYCHAKQQKGDESQTKKAR